VPGRPSRASRGTGDGATVRLKSASLPLGPSVRNRRDFARGGEERYFGTSRREQRYQTAIASSANPVAAASSTAPTTPSTSPSASSDHNPPSKKSASRLTPSRPTNPISSPLPHRIGSVLQHPLTTTAQQCLTRPVPRGVRPRNGGSTSSALSRARTERQFGQDRNYKPM
jgi:hypothetical protein